MIYDTLEHRDQYRGLSPRLAKALDFLAETDFSALPDGRCDIDGDEVFANVMTYETKTANETPESHRRYMDIQYLIEGEELVGVGALERMTEVVEARPEGDIWLHRGPVDYVTIGQGRFVAVWPGDAHAPGIAPDGVPKRARKCVVKVQV